MRKILVTGAAGFAGRHLVRALLQAGDEVHAVDGIVPGTGGIDPERGWPLFDPRDHPTFHFRREDCRDWFARTKDSDFDYAFHLAAIVGGRATIESAPLTTADDLSIDAAYWRWAGLARPAKTVYFSSSAAYPVALQAAGHYALLKEDMISFDRDIGLPDLAYGWAKLTGEYLARLAYARNGLKSVCYRPFSGYGEDQDDAYPFPSVCRRVLASRNAATLTVWGSGAQMRDFIHIDDCIEGVLATMDRIDDGGAINLSTGIYTSFIEFAQTAAEIAGYRTEVRGMADKPEGVFARAGDTAKQKQLGFSYQVGFRAGISRALSFYAQRRPSS